MARYTEAAARAETLEDMLGVATRIYREDLEAGHMTVVSELMAGSMAHPELKAEIIARMEPWIRFAEEAIRKVVSGSPFEDALPVRHVAFAIVAFYCGINMLSNLSEDRSQTEELFEAARADGALPGGDPPGPPVRLGHCPAGDRQDGAMTEHEVTPEFAEELKAWVEKGFNERDPAIIERLLNPLLIESQQAARGRRAPAAHGPGAAGVRGCPPGDR
jgi:hypothetical protein